MMNRFMDVAVASVLLFVGQNAIAEPEEGQYYRINCVRSKLVLSVENMGKEEGAQVIQVVQAATELQQWKFVKDGDYYKIVNRKTGKALNVKDGSKVAGTPVIQWDANAVGENQQWSLVKKGDFFAIKARHSGLALTVADGSKERRAILNQWPLQKADNGNQIFELAPVKDKK